MSKNNYTISQEYLIKLENECLIEKIAKLEKELAQKELEIKMLKKDLQPFLEAQNKRKEYLERRDKIDEKINKMLYNFHNQNK
jgi:alkylhydroperoxidase/carboxymuconolactone decarboxylase family protein YurZ